MARHSAKKRVRIEVTEADIARAMRSNSSTCVVAQAVARTIPDAKYIDVDIQTIRFTTGDGERLAYLTPYSVQGYIVAFDAGDDIAPFKFQLRDPQRLRRKVRTEAGKAVDRAYTRQRRPKKESDGASDESIASVKAAYGGAQLSNSEGGAKAPPRVFKRKQRTYGHRGLRVNQ